MLIGTRPRRPDIAQIRRIKRALREVLALSDEATVTVAELACLEEGCAPVETVIGLLRPNAAQLQHRLHKTTDAVDAEDLAQVCAAWGFDVPALRLTPLLKER